MAHRLEVRLDTERHSRLELVAREMGAPISEVVRHLIDDAYEEIGRARRLRAVERMAAMSLDVPEDPQEVFDAISEARASGSLH